MYMLTIITVSLFCRTRVCVVHLCHAVLNDYRQPTWKNPVEVTILHLLVVLILLQAEGRVRQVPVNKTSLLCLCQALQIIIEQLTPGSLRGMDNLDVGAC